MKAWDIIAYTADADIYCPECAERLYPGCEGTADDHEGNEVHPVFASDEIEPPVRAARRANITKRRQRKAQRLARRITRRNRK